MSRDAEIFFSRCIVQTTDKIQDYTTQYKGHLETGTRK